MQRRWTIQQLADRFMAGHMPPPPGAPQEAEYFSVLLGNIRKVAGEDEEVEQLQLNLYLLAGTAPERLQGWLRPETG